MEHVPGAELIALDWGSSSCRAYLVGAQGRVLATRASARGVMVVTADAADRGVPPEQLFQEELLALCHDWLAAAPALPVIASGMVGSNQGWAEADYLELPVDLLRTAIPLTTARWSGGEVHIVPGLVDRGELPDVMRGEETQILGTLLDAAARGAVRAGEECVVLPGTHTKWAHLSGSIITGFHTAMAGEVYGLLKSRSILSRLAEPAEQPRWAAFERGLDVALQSPAGVLGTVFSARSLVLAGRITGTDVQDYLSGLLVGSEVAGAVAAWLGGRRPPVVLCGEPDLRERYGRALARLDIPSTSVSTNVTPLALHHIAQMSGLVSAGAGDHDTAETCPTAEVRA
ncbi:MAG TPA: 2-dehydro-3-deoxygalactonokinase [Streptosporangiaceae bacterium]|nr:2-dehydro-3-deoxygalactonokinase [Streptosporangiaceae bacterium]